MSLPDPLTIKYEGVPLAGIINKIKNTFTDPISSNIVVPFSTQAGYEKLITWSADYSSNSGADKAYVYIRFPGRFLFPTHYTIRGMTNIAYFYQKKWTVYGYNAGEENDASKWTVLAENESTSSTFCGNGASCIKEGRSTTFSMISTKKGFEYIRFKTTESSGSNLFFVASAIEFFGTLSTKNVSPNNGKQKVSIYRVCTLRESLLFIRYLTSLMLIK